jgi:hypothetical protein
MFDVKRKITRLLYIRGVKSELVDWLDDAYSRMGYASRADFMDHILELARDSSEEGGLGSETRDEVRRKNKTTA